MVTTKGRVMQFLTIHGGWMSGSRLEDMAHTWNTKASTISRRCRELEDEGKLERMINGKAVQYRVVKPRMSNYEAAQYLEKLRLEEEKERQKVLL